MPTPRRKHSKPPARKKIKAGAKSKLTRKLIELVGRNIMAGNTKKTTCMAVGISQQTFYRWMKEGKEQKRGLKCEFCESVKKAEAVLKTALVSKIMNSPNWQAQAWLLERMFPEEYGRRQVIAHSGADEHNPASTNSKGAPIVRIFMERHPDEESPWIYDDSMKNCKSTPAQGGSPAK